MISWRRCTACQHVYTDGTWSPEAQKIIFARTNEHQKVGADFEQARFVSAHMVERVLRYCNHHRHAAPLWLDVGFGNGSLLFTAQEFGFTPVGIDLRVQEVDALRRHGIDAYCFDLLNLPHDHTLGPFAVVSMADVLEHTVDPGAMLAAVRRLMRRGVVLVSMPNMDTALWRAMDAEGTNPYWNEIEHYHNFTRASLCRLLVQHGFTPAAYHVSERYRCCMEVVATCGES